uniref:Myofilin n=2 Tax=Cacopsylla melanoneura TaxID=428564 RepID=A0A8D8XKC1_9HEMI
MMLKQHLDMIGRNEPIQRKAKFWQSYVRALKGTDDMRAPEVTHYHPPSRPYYRPFVSDYPSYPSFKSIYDDPINPHERINVPGYRYLPISRDTYGISPRNIQPHHYPHHYERPYPRVGIHGPIYYWGRLSPVRTHDSPLSIMLDIRLRHLLRDTPFKGLRDWDDHLNRIAALNSIFPYSRPAYYYPKRPIRPYYLPRSWTPLRPLPSERASVFNHLGQPIYTRGGYLRKPLSELLEPNWLTPKSRITLDDPWWWEYPELRPFVSPYTRLPRTPFYLRDSFLSPIKRTYLWGLHPVRPFYSHRRRYFY